MADKTFRTALSDLLNEYSRENISNTPDWILRDFLSDCLQAFDGGIINRDTWYGTHLKPGEGIKLPT